MNDIQKFKPTPLQRKILKYLETYESATYQAIQAATKRPRITCYDNIMKLYNVGLIHIHHRTLKGRGRPKTIFSIDYRTLDELKGN
jgi:predicted transcriptional regulator